MLPYTPLLGAQQELESLQGRLETGDPLAQSVALQGFEIFPQRDPGNVTIWWAVSQGREALERFEEEVIRRLGVEPPFRRWGAARFPVGVYISSVPRESGNEAMRLLLNDPEADRTHEFKNPVSLRVKMGSRKGDIPADARAALRRWTCTVWPDDQT